MYLAFQRKAQRVLDAVGDEDRLGAVLEPGEIDVAGKVAAGR